MRRQAFEPSPSFSIFCSLPLNVQAPARPTRWPEDRRRGGERLPDHLKPDWNRVAGGVIDNPEVIIIQVRPSLRRIGDLVEAQELAKRDLFARILLFEPRFGNMVVFPGYHDGLSCVAGIGEGRRGRLPGCGG